MGIMSLCDVRIDTSAGARKYSGVSGSVRHHGRTSRTPARYPDPGTCLETNDDLLAIAPKGGTVMSIPPKDEE